MNRRLEPDNPWPQRRGTRAEPPEPAPERSDGEAPAAAVASAEEPEPAGQSVVAEPEAPAETPPEPEAEPEDDAAASLDHAPGMFRVPDGYSVLEGDARGGRRTVGVVVARFNREITRPLLEGALEALAAAGVARDAILVMPVPGAFELPIAAMALAKTRRYSCIIALGCVIRGETSHFDFVAGEAASGLQLAAIETGVPVSFGVLTCETREQAEARVDRGAEAARTALEMADAFSQLRATAATR